MNQLFPSYLVSGSVKTQDELNKIFATYPELSITFLAIAVYDFKFRNWYEEWWPQLEKYLDQNFVTEFQKKDSHHQRAWEFHLGVVLLKNKSNLQPPKGAGPDFCVLDEDGNKIWVEAVSCNRGVNDPVEPRPELLPNKIYTFGGNIEDIHRTKVLRITNSIANKLDVIEKYSQKQPNVVNEKDCIIIAVNGEQIGHHSRPEMLIRRAVFGQGPYVYIRDAGEERLVGPYYQPKVTVIKRVDNGVEKEIPTNLMELDKFSKISAVIYSGNDASHSWYNEYELGDDFVFAYHSNPINPVPNELFKFGTSIRKDSKTQDITSKGQKI